MAATVYDDYSRDKVGWFFGLSGPQLVTVAFAAMPVFWAIKEGAWFAVLLFALIWGLVFAVAVVEVRGRSATGWLAAATTHALGTGAGWNSFRNRATTGAVEDLAEADLPGVLGGIAIHEGPPQGSGFARIAIIQDHAARTWAVTAAVTHPGTGMSDGEQRRRYGQGLSGLLDLAARGEMIDEILFMVRTVPEDGAERDLWIQRHRRPDGPPLSRTINNELALSLSSASVRTESYVSIVVPETRIARDAKESGGGLEGRARVLLGLMGEVEAQLVGGLGMTAVNWLTSPQLALACRTGFAPGDRAGIVEAMAARERDPGVNADVAWAHAGPSGADPLVRHYGHDAWNSISSTIKLSEKGAVIGALAPVLTPAEPGERRSFVVAFPILAQRVADRATRNAEAASDMGSHLRAKAGVKQRARQRTEAARAAGMDAKLATGAAMVRPYAVCTVTVPKTLRIAEFGRRLDASVRRAGFGPLRLDLSQDSAFAASSVPLGISLTRRGDA